MSLAFIEPRDCTRMDIETVLARIGGFGRAQKKIFYSVSFLQSLCAVHLLSLPFIGTDPGWSCRAKTAQGTWEPVADSEKCSNYERGECTPEYSKEFTSIVSEVRATPTYYCQRMSEHAFMKS